MEVSPVQPSHALVKLTSSSASVLNVTTGKDVSEVQPFHVLETLVPLDISRAGKDVSELQ